MNQEDLEITSIYNSEQFSRMTENMYAHMLSDTGSLDDAQSAMNFAMNAAYLYVRNFEAGKRRHITERCLNAEKAKREDTQDEFANTGSGPPE